MDVRLTPMMRQYLEIKKNYPDDILFFRLGDFYEMFFDDAHTASKILDIALTSRQNDIPMCGIPYHAADSYVARLIKAGYRVVICEQMEAAPSSGTVVRRDVVRVVTPGTIVEQNLLQSDDNNFLASAVIGAESIGLAFIDISTGDFYLSSIERSLDVFRGELTRFNPREMILKVDGVPDDAQYAQAVAARSIPVSKINEWLYDTDYLTSTITDVFNLASVRGLGITTDIELLAAGSILEYLRDTQKKTIEHLKYPQRIVSSEFMMLDEATIASLELVKNQLDGTKQRTLFSVLNRTSTAMGRRLLDRNILQPLTNPELIEKRLDMVQHLCDHGELLQRVQTEMEKIFDMERLLSRFHIGRYNPTDFIALRESIAAASAIRGILAEQQFEPCERLASMIGDPDPLAARIAAVIADNPALSPEHGRVIRPGYSAELDRLYDLKKDARAWILSYQEEEKQKLGIPTLKVKYNKILGYYIEVSKGQTAKVPAEYYRKQTLVSGERYTTETLQKFETDILHASDKITHIENEEIIKLLADILSYKDELQKAASAIAETDYFCSLSRAAVENKYVRPHFNDVNRTDIKDGRHPMVERYYTKEVFIPNDVQLDSDERVIMLITGPNMSGKSTYIRMAAIIQLMAQIGSFVPASSADLSPVDRIFTRIGASDNISRGESTFLVEMNETAVILNNATSKSLIVMDEVGRGTSTFDGLSIAWAVVEYILRYVKAKTLFATHYHELTELGDKKGIINCNVLVKEHMSGVDFLHRVAPGAADKSYGIHVAKLAGIPKEITARATRILEKLEKTSRGSSAKKEADAERSSEQLEIFNAANHVVIQAIRNIDIDGITPLDAINELNRLKKLIE